MRLSAFSQIILLVLLLGALAMTHRQTAFAEDTGYELSRDIYALINADLQAYRSVRQKVIDKWQAQADELERLCEVMPAMYRAVGRGLAAQLRHGGEYEEFRKTYNEMMIYWAEVNSRKDSLQDTLGNPTVGFSLGQGFYTEFRSGWAEVLEKSKGDPGYGNTMVAKYRLRFFLPNTVVTEPFLREVLVTPYLIGELPEIVHQRAAPYGAYTVASCNALWPIGDYCSIAKSRRPSDLFFQVFFTRKYDENLLAFHRFAYISWNLEEFYPFFADSSGIVLPNVRMGSMDQIVRTELPFDGTEVKGRFEKWVAENPEKADEYRKLVTKIKENGIPTPEQLYPDAALTLSPAPPSVSASPSPTTDPTGDGNQREPLGNTTLYVVIGLVICLTAVALLIARKRK